jgi:hypothetical protein
MHEILGCIMHIVHDEYKKLAQMSNETKYLI